MAIIVSAPEGEGNYTPIETGTYQAVCAEVVDVGLRECKAFDGGEPKMKHKIIVVWELNETRDDGKRFIFSREYVASLHEKSSLRKDLDAWRGVPFTSEELKGFDVEKVVGANCMLTISAYEKQNGNEGRKVTGVSKCMKGLVLMSKSEQYDRPRYINELLGLVVSADGHSGDDLDLPF